MKYLHLRRFGISLFFALVVMTSASAQPKPKRVLFFGDSITEQGVKAGGYITKIQDALLQKGIADRFELVGSGVSGNKIYDLYLRLEKDVLEKAPDVVVIYVGVNDVWHKSLAGTGTDADKFERFYNAIIAKLKAKNISLIFCTPSVIGERIDHSNPQDGDLNFYSQVIRNLAKQNACTLCDLRKAFLEYNLINNPENKASGILTTDRVHLNDKGNQLVADLLLRELLK